MSKEIENLVANSKDREALARIFDFAAEKLAAPLEFTHDGEPAEEDKKTEEATAHGR